jgi:hypothetical protein
MNEKLILFTDLVGRTIIGEETVSEQHGEGSPSSRCTTLSIKNPAIIHIQPVSGKQGQIQVQVLPYLIPEFITSSKRRDPVIWYFSTNGINIPQNLEIDAQLVKQYDRLFNPTQIIVPDSAPIVNLFDSDKK